LPIMHSSTGVSIEVHGSDALIKKRVLDPFRESL